MMHGLTNDFRPTLLALAVGTKALPGLESIFGLISPHPLLVDFPRVMVNLRSVINAMGAKPELVSEKINSADWIKAITWVLDLGPNDARRMGEKFHLGDVPGHQNPLSGRGIIRHPNHGMLWFWPADPDARSVYFRLVGQIFLACGKVSKLGALNGQLNQARRALEHLCVIDQLRFPKWFNPHESADKFLQQCKSLHKSAKRDSSLLDEFSAIAWLIRVANGEKVITRKTVKRRRRKFNNALQPLMAPYVSFGSAWQQLGDPDDPDSRAGRYQILISTPPEAEPWIDEGLPGAELADPIERWLIDFGIAQTPAAAHILAAQGIRDYICRDRQKIPDGWNGLTLIEMATLLFGCTQRLFELKTRVDALRVLDIEAMAALHSMIWTGQPLERVLTLKVISKPAAPKADFELLILEKSNGYAAEWRFSAHCPDYKTDEAQNGQLHRPRTGWVHLPDLANGAQFILLLNSLRHEGEPLFSESLGVMERRIKALLRAMGFADSRYTILKARRWLFLQFLRVTHDVTAAALMTGVPDLASSVPLYYTAHSIKYLRERYCQILHHQLRQIYACARMKYKPQVERAWLRTVTVGARTCPTTAVMSTNVSALFKQLRCEPGVTSESLCSWHNAYTLYSHQLFSQATACRAIISPWLTLSDLNQMREGGICLGALSDKDAADRHMSRLVVLPDFVRQQIKNYAEHREALQRLLRDVVVLPDEDLFFLSLDRDKFRTEVVRPVSLKIVMDKMRVFGYQPLPANIHRKFFRTELLERGCPPEVVGAWMGHWLHGEEPYDLYSSFSPLSYSKAITSHLTPLMRELGWRSWPSKIQGGKLV